MSLLLPTRPADRITWGAVAASAGVIAVALVQYWGFNPGYADRFLIVLGSGYAAHSLAPFWVSIPVRPRPVLGLPLALIAWALFAVGAFLLVQIGPRTLLLWWLTGTLALVAAGITLARLGVGRLRAALFPILFVFFALPTPLRILNPLQDQLQSITTTAAFHALGALGYEVEQTEYVLALPGGKLRVEEACSGVRSLTALTAIAAFVAFWRGFGPVRGVSLVLLAIPVVAAVNVLRVVLSGVIQEWFGSEYIRDAWHESLGFAMVFVGLGLILTIANRLAPAEEPPGPPPAPVDGPPRRGATATALVALVGTALTIWGLWAGQGTFEARTESAPLADIPLQLDGWKGQDLPVPAVVSDLLAPDVALYRRYVNNVGQDVYVWAFYWGTGAAIKGYHHPDVCWGNNGFAANDRWTEPFDTGAGVVPVTAREFRSGQDRQVVLYWTQEGRHIWTETDEKAAETDMLTSSWSGHQWVGDLLGASHRTGGPRLQVVVICPAAGSAARRSALNVGQRVATELYKICPWAGPAGD